MIENSTVDASSHSTAGSRSSTFSDDLRVRVAEYFRTTGRRRTGDLRMAGKVTFYLGSFAVLYAWLLFGGLSTGAMFGLIVAMGFLIAGIGFNVGHDAIHGACSSRTGVNHLFGYAFTLMGADVAVWRNLHNSIHHNYTNIPEADGDLHPVKWLRFYPHTDAAWYHKFQHVYAFALYTLTTFVWVFQKDYVHTNKEQHLIHKRGPASRRDWVELFVGKTLYYIAFLVVPMIVLPLAWWQVFIGFTAMHLVAGLSLALVFQLGHLVEGTSFPNISASGKTQAPWLEHQLLTSANFATRNPLASFMLGGLNFQIEHHLFPGVCHVHYPQLAPIVKQTAKEHGLPYVEYPSFTAALRSHARYLYAMGRAPAATAAGSS